MDVSTGFQYYAIFNQSIGLLVLFCIGCFLIYIISSMMTKNYQEASNSQITYKSYSNNTYTLCTPIINSADYNSNCKYYAEYDVNNQHYIKEIQVVDRTKPPSLGSTKIFYSKNDPNDYVISTMSPLLMSEIGCGVVCCLILVSIIHLFLITKFKGLGAVEGGINAGQNILGALRRN